MPRIQPIQTNDAAPKAKDLLNAVQAVPPGGHIEVRWTSPDGRSAVLEVADDGRGFDVGSLDGAYEEGHFGVRMLSDVVNAAGGDLELKSTPGVGTTLTLVAPR